MNVHAAVAQHKPIVFSPKIVGGLSCQQTNEPKKTTLTYEELHRLVNEKDPITQC